MTTKQEILMWRRLLWLVYAEEAAEGYNKNLYPKTFLYKIKKKITNRLEECEKQGLGKK